MWFHLYLKSKTSLKKNQNIDLKSFPANRWEQLIWSALLSDQLGEEACLLNGQKNWCLCSHTSSSSTGLYTPSLNFCISPSVEFSSFLTLLYTPHFGLLQSPRYLHLLQRRQLCFVFSNSTKAIWFQTGIKVCQLLNNNYVALFKCSLSLLDEKLCDFMLSKNTRRQYVCIFRCLGFLKILQGLLLFFVRFCKSHIFFFRNKVKRSLWKNIYPFILPTGSVLAELARQTKRMKVLLSFWFWGRNSQRTLWSPCWYRACIVEHWRGTREREKKTDVKC